MELFYGLIESLCRSDAFVIRVHAWTSKVVALVRRCVNSRVTLRPSIARRQIIAALKADLVALFSSISLKFSSDVESPSTSNFHVPRDGKAIPHRRRARLICRCRRDQYSITNYAKEIGKTRSLLCLCINFTVLREIGKILCATRGEEKENRREKVFLFFLLNFLASAGLFGRKSLRKLLIHELDGCFWWEWEHLDASSLIFTNPGESFPWSENVFLFSFIETKRKTFWSFARR